MKPTRPSLSTSRFPACQTGRTCLQGKKGVEASTADWGMGPSWLPSTVSGRINYLKAIMMSTAGPDRRTRPDGLTDGSVRTATGNCSGAVDSSRCSYSEHFGIGWQVSIISNSLPSDSNQTSKTQSRTNHRHCATDLREHLRETSHSPGRFQTRCSAL